jgi:thiamine phosphate synthase YjbQ (UPF0047 family)
MNPQLIRDAVDNLRKIVKKGTYRHLTNRDLVDVEAHLQWILMEIEVRDFGLWDMIKKSLKELK